MRIWHVVPALLSALLIGAVFSLVRDAVGNRRVAQERAAALKALQVHADSLERMLLFLETERLQTAAKVRADSIATALAAKKVGPVLSRDTVAKTALIVIEGTPKLAPLQLVEKTEALERENASLRVDRLNLEQLAATWMARAQNAEAQLKLERENRPSRLERLVSDVKKVTAGAAAGGLLVLILL